MRYETDDETGGLGTGFTDMCINQPLYTVNGSVNIAPHFLLSSEHHTVPLLKCISLALEIFDLPLTQA